MSVQLGLSTVRMNSCADNCSPRSLKQHLDLVSPAMAGGGGVGCVRTDVSEMGEGLHCQPKATQPSSKLAGEDDAGDPLQYTGQQGHVTYFLCFFVLYERQRPHNHLKGDKQYPAGPTVSGRRATINITRGCRQQLTRSPPSSTTNDDEAQEPLTSTTTDALVRSPSYTQPRRHHRDKKNAASNHKRIRNYARLHHSGSKLDPRLDLRSTQKNCCTIRVRSWTGDRDEIHFEQLKLAGSKSRSEISSHRRRGDLVVRLFVSYQGEPDGFDSQRGRSRIFASKNRGGRCRWSSCFLGVLPSPPFSFRCCFILISVPSPSSALKTLMLRAVQISSLTHSAFFEETADEILLHQLFTAMLGRLHWSTAGTHKVPNSRRDMPRITSARQVEGAARCPEEGEHVWRSSRGHTVMTIYCDLNCPWQSLVGATSHQRLPPQRAYSLLSLLNCMVSLTYSMPGGYLFFNPLTAFLAVADSRQYSLEWGVNPGLKP
ncbi:hypothetical protein PR048_032849 [Dryococelus australis]|uniref:Uncharacterized protein n=1 Tax=Dryococelus australis TaxID=614101 RepID=A0ABQ9G4J5_9NEOP|nr:hypothetical protein PR048_032849 [Dryococelus australis]